MEINKQGFSIFEVIVYIALFSLVIVSILTIAARSLSSKTKAIVIQEVEHNARYSMARIASDIRSATDIDESDLDVSNILTLTMADGSEVQYARSSSSLTIERNSSGAINLTSDDVTVDTFTLENNTSTDVSSEYQTVTVTLGISAGAAVDRPEYKYDYEVTSTISIRQ